MTQEIDIEKYHQLALQKQKEHRKVLANLKKKPPKNLDKIRMKSMKKFSKKSIVPLVPIAVRP